MGVVNFSCKYELMELVKGTIVIRTGDEGCTERCRGESFTLDRVKLKLSA